MVGFLLADLGKMPRSQRPGVPDIGPELFETYLRSYFEDLQSALNELDPAAVSAVAAAFEQARQEGRQIFIVGNGGSAATAAHMACDLGKGTVDFRNPEFTRFRTLSLADNNALLTALANDLAFEDVFSEQLASLMQDGDVVVIISASGNSPNLVRAAQYARSRQGTLVGLLGFGGGTLGTMVDHALVVSSRNYGIAEDSHLIVQHVLTQYLRRLLAGPVRQAAFLDRDGVINDRPAPHEYVTSWDAFRWADGVVPMLRGLSELGYALIVVTNQQGVGKGVISESTLGEIHAKMIGELERQGISILRVVHCPHLEREQCLCRKPRPGLIYRALNDGPELIDLSRSLLIGDSGSDVQAGRAAGVGTRILVGEVDDPTEAATHRVASLHDVLRAVTRDMAGAEFGVTA